MLKYLFTAKYADGTSYIQNPEDISTIEPEKRSCFFDVNHEQLVVFVLKGDGHEYLVDLRDGHFEIDGQLVEKEEKELTNFRLIFFRQHTQSFFVSQIENKPLSHEIEYHFGWQANDIDGKNYQKIVKIK